MRFLAAAILVSGCTTGMIGPDAGAPADAGCLRPSATLLDFGEAETGTTRLLHLQLTNLTAAPLTVTARPLAPPFTVTFTGPQRVNVGAHTEFELRFRPIDGLLHLSNLVIDAEDGCTLEIPLRGLGAGGLVVAPLALAFGGLDPGDSKTLEVTLTNTRRTPLPLGGIAIVGAEMPSGRRSPFSVAAPSQSELGAQSSAVIPVSVTITDLGFFRAQLVVDSLGVTVPLEVVSGTPIAEFSRDAFEVPRVHFDPLATTYPAFVERTLQLRNAGVDGGAMNLIVMPMLRVEHEDGGVADAKFKLIRDHSFEGPGKPAGTDGAPLVIRYEPADFGRRSFTLVVQTNDPNYPEHRISFTATAVSLPDCSLVAPTEVQFTPTSNGRSEGSVIFTNSGSTPCVLDAIRVDEFYGFSAFTVLDGGIEQRELAPGESHEVTLSGPEAGARGGLLLFHELRTNDRLQAVRLRAPP